MSYLEKCICKTDLLMNKLKPGCNIILFVLNKNIYFAYTLNDMKEIMKAEKNHYIKRIDNEIQDNLQTFFHLPYGIVIDESLKNCFNDKVNTMSLTKSERNFRIGFGNNQQIFDFYSVEREDRIVIGSDEPSLFDEKQEFSYEKNEVEIDWNEVKKQKEKRQELEMSRIPEEDKKWYDEVFCLGAVKRDGFALQYVKNQTEEICLEAVKNYVFKWDECALQYVKNQTDAICLEAVKENGMALLHIRNQTLELCLEAVKQNKKVFDLVKNQTQAVKQNNEAVQYVKTKR